MIVERKIDWHRRVLNVFLLLCIFFLVAQIVWRAGIVPRLKIQRVVLESDIPIGDEQLLNVLDIQNKPWSLFNKEDMQLALTSLATVKEARVEKIFPDTLKVWIAQRQPLALMVNGREENLVFFDNEGVVIALGIKESFESLDLPIVTGVNLSEVTIGDQLPEELRTLMRDIDEIRTENIALYGLISEIRVIPDEISSYYLRIYMNHIQIPFLVNRKISTQLLREALLVLDILDSGKMGKVDEADLRGETLVFHSGSAT